MPTPIRDLDPLVESHEERLRNIEDEHKEVLTAIAVTNEKQETLASRVNDGFASVMEKMESYIVPLAEKIDRHVEDSKVNAAKYTVLTERVDVLDEVHQKKLQRIAMLKKGVWALALTLGGAFAKLVFEYLVK